MNPVRVRFAPSPTGGLHIGGVRTALFNYLFAKANQGEFVLRIEDTDQTRYVEGAEAYIVETLNWLSLSPDEGPEIGGQFGPYRQSERNHIYKQYVDGLIEDGHAYLAFDTPEELDELREKLKAEGVANLNYNSSSRMTMRNSLTLSEAEVQELLKEETPYVVRLKVPAQEEVRFFDEIRGWVLVHSMNLDDKVLMKSDGFPTYHLANVVDDHLMKITHVIRGEEWLPSLPIHVLLYKYLGWEDEMPAFAHLPLILKPDGNGKLSKRAADKAGFPIFPLSWTDANTNEENIGFKESGYLPEAMINFLALLGWNPGGEQEVFSLNDLASIFSLEKVGKSGTKFSIEKATWFNQHYIKERSTESLTHIFVQELAKGGLSCDLDKAAKIIELLKPRVSFLQDFLGASRYFFMLPEQYDQKVVRKKWDQSAAEALKLFAEALAREEEINAEQAKELYSITLNDKGFNPGKVMQNLRLSLTGEGSGPDLMMIIEIMGGLSASQRIFQSIETLNKLKTSLENEQTS